MECEIKLRKNSSSEQNFENEILPGFNSNESFKQLLMQKKAIVKKALAALSLPDGTYAGFFLLKNSIFIIEREKRFMTGFERDGSFFGSF